MIEAVADPAVQALVEKAVTDALANKAAIDAAALAAQYAFYSIIVQSVATVAGAIVAGAFTYFLRKLEKNTNSIMKDLNRSIAAASHAQGVIQGVKDEKERIKAENGKDKDK